MTEKKETRSATGDHKDRFEIANSIISASVLIIFVLALVIMIVGTYRSGTDEGLKIANNTFNTLLPLIGTWVGTILAYYFSKDNFEAANKNVQEIVEKLTPMQKLGALFVKDKMIPLAGMAFTNIAEDLKTVKLSDLLNTMTSKSVNRLPLLKKDNAAKYVVHRSMLDKYLVRKALSEDMNAKKIKALTLDDLMNEDPVTKAVFENSFVIVPESATLAKAKIGMDEKTDCRDVLVTRTGAADEPVIGWLTNNIIAENAKV